ncbi:zinc finger protein ZFAT isoform X2 [Etheostoma spectabile]|uniref:zinc finger protein ZFAT isoform X2 n=1 Tax=Etheostoma spectabile TaxID=54343 RepID=UPI0013AF8A88|nr:zinc finger protein ZFAT-like isoform X2 [Etheostoma spectabile]
MNATFKRSRSRSLSSSADMDTTMIQLRLFVHQRLYTAAEEILGEVEKTITLALHEADVSHCESEELQRLRHQLALEGLRKKSAAEPSLTISSVGRGDECDAPLLPENTGLSPPEEDNFSLGAELQGPSHTSAELDYNNWHYCLVHTDFKVLEIKEEREELGDDHQTQEMGFPSPEIVNSEQNQPETQPSYELQPVALGCPSAQSENNDSDEELVTSKGEQKKTVKRKRKMFRKRRGKMNKKAALSHDKSSAKSEKERSFCHFCGKGFKLMLCLKRHIQKHETKFDCTVCGMKCQSREPLVAHLKSYHNNKWVCDVCCKHFSKIGFLRVHQRRMKHKAAEPSLTISSVGRGDECDAPLLPENTGPSTPEEDNFSLGAEVQGPSQTSADLDDSNWNDCLVQTDFRMLELKKEQEGQEQHGNVNEMDQVALPLEKSSAKIEKEHIFRHFGATDASTPAF